MEFILCKTKQPLLGMELQEKEEDKDEKTIGKLIRKNEKGKKKAFYRQRIPESSRARKEAVDIYNLSVTKDINNLPCTKFYPNVASKIWEQVPKTIKT